MKILNEYQKIIKDAGNIQKAYFTTFNISAQFVEKYVLPPLLEKDFCKDWYDYIDIDKALMASKIDIKFFYDYNMYDDAEDEKKTLVKFYPIKQERGVFHPKVIYVEGDKKAFLIVGSGNLTKNGWSENIEAFYSVEVFSNNPLFDNLNIFWNKVFSLANDKPYKSNKKFIHPPEENSSIYPHKFIFSNHYNKDKVPFLEGMKDESSFLQVWSPYFSNDINDMINDKLHKENIYIIPDFTSEDKIRIDNVKTLSQLQNSNIVSIYKEIQESDSKRVNHSKVWLSKNKLAIGSYNFTAAALYGNNFEAALILENINSEALTVDKLRKDRYECVDISSLQTSIGNILEDDREKNNFSKRFQVTIDWKDRGIKISPVLKKSEIIIFDKEYDHVTITNMSDIEKENLFDFFIVNKSYRIFDDHDTLLYQGLIIEFNADENNRKILKIESLDEMFSFDEKIIENGDNREVMERILNYRENRKVKQTNNNIDYYNIFNFFHKKLLELNKILSNPKALHRFYYQTSTSLKNIKNILETEKADVKNHNLQLYIMIYEYSILQKISKKNDLIMENINIGLNEKDEHFIASFSNVK